MLEHYLVTHLLTVVTAIVSTLMVLRLLSTNRAPQSPLAWVLALTFVPLAAVPLYFLIGTRKFPRTAKRGMALPTRRESVLSSAVARVLQTVGAPSPRTQQRFQLLEDGESAYTRLLALIAEARHSIVLSVFILGDDPVSGAIANDVTARFESDWAFCGGDDAVPPPASPSDTRASSGNNIAQFVPSGPDMVHDIIYSAILTAIFVATERVAIVIPYYVPDEVLQRALILAARRGVRTQVVLPSRSNHPMADFARRGLLRALAAAGVELRFYPLGMLHAKAMVVDEWFALIGSANIDMRSLSLNYEDAFCFYSTDDVSRIRTWMDRLVAECTTEFPHSHREYWLLEQAARLLAPEL